MRTNYPLDKSFGPVGTIAGVTIFLAGLVLIYFTIAGLILIVFGAFVGFTSTSTLVDVEGKRVKFCNNLFGIIPVGRWVNIDSAFRIGVEKSNRTWRVYSRGSRSLDISDRDYRIVLYDAHKKPIMPIMKTNTAETAKLEADILRLKLGLESE